MGQDGGINTPKCWMSLSWINALAGNEFYLVIFQMNYRFYLLNETQFIWLSNNIHPHPHACVYITHMYINFQAAFIWLIKFSLKRNGYSWPLEVRWKCWLLTRSHSGILICMFLESKTASAFYRSQWASNAIEYFLMATSSKCSFVSRRGSVM